MSDFDPIKWSTRLDGHGLAPAVEPDQYAQWGGHGMEEVRGSSPLSSTHYLSWSGAKRISVISALCLVLMRRGGQSGVLVGRAVGIEEVIHRLRAAS
jgi:hypothetical protein